MDDAGRAALESEIRALVDAGKSDRAATRAIQGYGPEIYGFLVAFHKSEQDAADVFAIVSENVWRGLATFSWDCSLRAWAYTVARNASYRFRKSARRDAARRVDVDDASEASKLAARVRTETGSFLKTETKDRFAALRASLPAEDQALLILRVDRRLAWEDLARIMLAGEAEADPNEKEEARDPTLEPTPEALKRESARLRKRFQLVKDRLTTLGEKAGLLKKRDD